MHEILHLSFGTRSNHLTSHFFNAQESYFTYEGDIPSPVDHDISFRSGQANDGTGRDTYTPRCLMWDFRGGRGSLKTYNDFYSQGEGEKSLWGDAEGEGVEMIREPPVKRSKYHDYLDGLVKVDPNQLEPILSADDINYWTDYSHLFYHPRSMREVQNWKYVPKSGGSGYRSIPRGASVSSENESNLPEFKGVENGITEWRHENEEIDQLDMYFRPFLEECDLLQGINMLCDFDTAWAGFSSQALADICDEYLNKPIVTVWQVLDPDSENTGASLNEIDKARKFINRLDAEREFSEITEGSSTLFVELGMPPRRGLAEFFKQPSVAEKFNYNSLWQTSAIHCLAFENQTFPTRLASDFDRVPMENLISTSFLSSFNQTNLQRVSSVDLAVLNGGMVSLSENMAEWNTMANRCLPVRRRGPSKINKTNNSPYVFGRSGLVRGGRSLHDVDEAWSRYSREWVNPSQLQVQEDAAGNKKFSDFDLRRLLSSNACNATLHRFGYPYLDSFPNLFPQLDRMRLENNESNPSVSERQQQQVNYLYTDFTFNTNTRRLYEYKLDVAKSRISDPDGRAAMIDYLSNVASQYAKSADFSSDSDEEMSD